MSSCFASAFGGTQMQTRRRPHAKCPLSGEEGGFWRFQPHSGSPETCSVLQSDKDSTGRGPGHGAPLGGKASAPTCDSRTMGPRPPGLVRQVPPGPPGPCFEAPGPCRKRKRPPGRTWVHRLRKRREQTLAGGTPSLSASWEGKFCSFSQTAEAAGGILTASFPGRLPYVGVQL